jgi:hypothetical protein
MVARMDEPPLTPRRRHWLLATIILALMMMVLPVLALFT